MSRSLVYKKRTKFNVPAQKLYQWHHNPDAFKRLMPPWEKITLLNPEENQLREGLKVLVRAKIGPFSTRMEFLNSNFIENKQFCDHLIKGPFKFWRHTHLIHDKKDKTSVLDDEIEYAMHYGAFGNWIAGRIVRRKLKRIFRYRHEVLKRDLDTHFQKAPAKPLNILIVGASGFIGSALKVFLASQGHEIRELSRTPEEGAFHWDPTTGQIDAKALKDLDAVVNLAGEDIIDYWTPRKKNDIYQSRIRSTKFLCQKLAKLDKKPSVLINASGINFYGKSRSDRLHEKSKGGEGFLASVCQDWEQATETASKAKIRVVNLRMGIVLSAKGGALARMLVPFKLGMGGRMGSGHQSISWISLDDLLDAVYFCILNKPMKGPVNATTPYPVSNFKFKQTLGDVLRRFALIPVPAFILKILLGEVAEETILSSLRVKPQKLLAQGFQFRYPKLDRALRHLLGR